ncbi:LutC/YkgG family protein [Antribacter gilvus]|uniref:LutC/YkgG family protein n=1 Tax=Antribacter gilvus TaxID=2304675 RepID=UPI000F7B11AA|nr:LUD domain-containing protein [Antribacter gilvus]
MSDARSEVLSRVRAALGRPDPEATDHVAAAKEVSRGYRAAGEHAPGSAEALEILVDRLVDYKAHVVQVPADGIAAAVAAALGDHVSSIVVPPGLDPAWLAGLDGVDVRTDSPEAPLTAAELDLLGAVVTAARVVIAETGTIVLDAGPDQGRRAISLVPDVHVCVVRAEQVVQTVPEAVRLLGAHPERPQTWISGPSATSDIELDRVEGVHGPRTLHVVLAT